MDTVTVHATSKNETILVRYDLIKRTCDLGGEEPDSLLTRYFISRTCGWLKAALLEVIEVEYVTSTWRRATSSSAFTFEDSIRFALFCRRGGWETTDNSTIALVRRHTLTKPTRL